MTAEKSSSSPCDELTGRLRDICRGFDDSGRPIRLPRAHSREKYLKLLLEQGRISRLPDDPPNVRTAISHTRPPCEQLGGQLRVEICGACGRNGSPAPVFACAKHGECTLNNYRIGVAKCCLTCSDFKSADRPCLTWSAGIMTSLREVQTLEKCLESVRACGWFPVVYAQPDAIVAADVPTVRRQEAMDDWSAWKRALSQLAGASTSFVLLCRDDVQLSRDSRALIESTEWPDDVACVSLLTPSHMAAGTPGLHALSTESFQSDHALVFRTDLIPRLLQTEAVRKWTDNSGQPGKAVAAACRELGLRIMGWSPSPGRSLVDALAVAVWRGGLLAAAIVLICSNYGRFLPTAVESALAQRHPAAEIVIVDDASVDETKSVADRFAGQGVRYLRIERKNTLAARAAGLDATSSPVVCFLDADDELPPDYLEAGLPCFSSPDVGIVFSDMEKFGDRVGRDVFPREDDHIDRMNYCHAGSLVRRDAIVSADCIRHEIPCDTMNDWYLWRRIVALGWRVEKSSAVYRYRKHPDSQSERWRSSGYFELANLALEPVTLFIPLSGRRDGLRELMEWVQRQPTDRLRLVLADSSQDPVFSRTIRRWMSGLSFSDARYYQQAVSRPGLADDDRKNPEVNRLVREAMPRIYSRLAWEATTEYVMIVEDDVLPPIDTIDRLLRGFDKRTAAVSGAYVGRHSRNIVAWDRRFRPLKAGEGLVRVHGTGFGCLMVRRSVLQSVVFTHGAPRFAFDLNFADHVSDLGLVFGLDWSVRCLHAGRALTDAETDQNSRPGPTG